MVLKMKSSCTGAAGVAGSLGDGVHGFGNATLAYDDDKQNPAHDGLGFGNATLAYDEDKQNPAHDGLGALPVHSQAGRHLPLVLQVTCTHCWRGG